jgi:hypothetical protein
MRLGTSVIAHPSAHVSLVQGPTPEPVYAGHFRSWLLRVLCGDRDAQARGWLLHVPEHLDRAPEILAGALLGILIVVAGVHASLAARAWPQCQPTRRPEADALR